MGNTSKISSCLSHYVVSQLCYTLLGTVAFDSGDESKNNAWVAALTFGEGWHNNHHAFPNSARQGLFKGQIDLTWEHIKFLARLGFAKKIKLPSRTYY